MKTTKIFIMVALALMTAACNKVDIDLNQQPANDEIIITATIDANDGATTRALSIDGSNIASTWEACDQFAILFNDGSNDVKRVASVDKIDGTTVTITFTIPSSLASNTPCQIVYPASAANAANTGADVATALATQDGTIGNCPEVRVGTATIDKDNHNLTSVTKLAAQNTIFKFTVQDLSAADKTATEFKVSDGSGNVLATVTPASAAGTLYVALPEMAAGTYWFTATIDDKAYVAKATTAAATTAGKYYQTTVKMATFGNVIGANGKFYVNAAAATSASTTASAMITYVGDETAEASPYTHGLALAMNDANGGSNCAWTTSSGSTVHTYTTTSSTFDSESGLQYNATQNSNTYPAFKYAIANNGTAAPIGCSAWFLASGHQWDRMISAAGNFNALRDGFSGVGGTNMQSVNYWSSTEESGSYAWTYYFFSGYGGGKWVIFTKVDGYYVRSALAF